MDVVFFLLKALVAVLLCGAGLIALVVAAVLLWTALDRVGGWSRRKDEATLAALRINPPCDRGAHKWVGSKETEAMLSRYYYCRRCGFVPFDPRR